MVSETVIMITTSLHHGEIVDAETYSNNWELWYEHGGHLGRSFGCGVGLIMATISCCSSLHLTMIM